MRLAVLPAIVALALSANEARADDPDQAQLLVWPRIAEIGGSAGVVVDSGAGTGKPSPGFIGYGRLDGAAYERPGLVANVIRVEVGGTSTDGARVGARLLSIDHAIFGTVTKLGPNGEKVTATCLWLLGGPCAAGTGYGGFGLDLVDLQFSLGGRSAFRIGELTGVWTPMPAYDDRHMTARVPIRVGATLDYLWGVPREGDAVVGRLVLGIDAMLRFADRHVELQAKVRYRPSFTQWLDDFGVEAVVGIGWVGPHRLFQPQGAPLRIGIELGYGHWHRPEHSFGLPWSDGARETFFARAVFTFSSVSVH